MGQDLHVIPMGAFPQAPPHWLWPGYLAAGRVALLEGEPGIGKSFVAIDLAARLSQGTSMPDGHPVPEPVPVLYVFGEDDPSDTFGPRAAAAGAHPDRFTAAFSYACDGGNPFADDPDRLTKLVKEANAQLTVIDPLARFVHPSAWASSPAASRAALQPFYAVTGVRYGAVLLVRHTAKGRGPWSIDRGLGGIGMIGSARTAWYVARHPDDPDLRVLSVTKQSAAPPGPSLGFRLTDGRVEWHGPVDVAADELVGDGPRGLARRRRDRAADWLRAQLAAGPRPATDLIILARRAGYPERTLNRAKADGRFRAQPADHDRKRTWYWFDPDVSGENPPLAPLPREEECSPIW